MGSKITNRDQLLTLFQSWGHSKEIYIGACHQDLQTLIQLFDKNPSYTLYILLSTLLKTLRTLYYDPSLIHCILHLELNIFFLTDIIKFNSKN